MKILAIIGAHAFFALEGASIDGITVSETAKPDADPIANWSSLGVIEENDINVAYEGETKHYAPTPGGYKQRRSTYESIEVSGSLLCQDMDAFVLSLAMGAKQADENGDYVPGSQTEAQRGWLKLQHYAGDTDELVNLMDIWVEFKVGGGIKFSKAVTKPSVDFTVLHSALNVGKFTNL
ncbi:MAG TPA: hypothetical protein DEA90_16245 [Opitutae bacterium]|nr:hypothetical protein [Puniceicoccaceae bacterium]HBR95708.1 hypothetical protein [Opitutae bacterium]|tara:strand:- start:13216 stop:13752 length:537 start_codon:yes stop_codon:yes gene_type:complete